VRHLKDHAEDESDREPGRGVERQHDPPGVEQQRNHHGPAKDEELAGEDLEQTHALGPRELVLAHAPALCVEEVLNEVHVEHGESVDRPHVEVLKAMHGASLLSRGEARERREVDVVVGAAHVRVGVVEHVVLPAP
jgi:hypothetical protein